MLCSGVISRSISHTFTTFEIITKINYKYNYNNEIYNLQFESEMNCGDAIEHVLIGNAFKSSFSDHIGEYLLIWKLPYRFYKILV